jgi:hypothetical protein
LHLSSNQKKQQMDRSSKVIEISPTSVDVRGFFAPLLSLSPEEDPLLRHKVLHITSLVVGEIKKTRPSLDVSQSNTIAVLTSWPTWKPKSQPPNIGNDAKNEETRPDPLFIPPLSSWPFCGADSFVPATFSLKLECKEGEILEFMNNSSLEDRMTEAQRDMREKDAKLHIICMAHGMSPEAITFMTRS